MICLQLARGISSAMVGWGYIIFNLAITAFELTMSRLKSSQTG
jgi:hypothetical protein